MHCKVRRPVDVLLWHSVSRHGLVHVTPENVMRGGLGGDLVENGRHFVRERALVQSEGDLGPHDESENHTRGSDARRTDGVCPSAEHDVERGRDPR
jgi:hypothetical protein